METALLSIDYIKCVVESVAKQYGIKRVFLFGSYAKNKATPESDIDLLIEKGKPISLLDISGIKMKLEEILKVPIDLLTTDGIENDFNNEINETEVLLYEE